jgi:hypothetical protein
MRPSSTLTLAALVLGMACASVPAFAQSRQSGTGSGYSNSTASGAPVSPNGISAAASAYGGPGYMAPVTGKSEPAGYSNSVAQGAPLSPNGIGAAPTSYGGPGYMAPVTGKSSTPAAYSNNMASGAPISPGGISAAANAYGGPAYSGH